MRQAIYTALLAFFCLTSVRGSTQQDDQQKAAALWDQAVAAKGGRERLAAIRSFAIHEKTAFTRPTLPEMAVGKVDQIVCALPDKWWEFLDYRPGEMGYSVQAADARTGLGWSTSGGQARPFLRPYTGLAPRMRRLQYLYFLETSAVRPTPARASRAKLGFRTVDRIEAVFDIDTIIVDLDVNTHLPIRIEIVTPITIKPPRPGVTVPPDTRFVFELSEYYDVAGVRVPRRVMLRSDVAEARVEIDPDYDPSIFTTPPSPDATIDSWRKRTAQSLEPTRP